MSCPLCKNVPPLGGRRDIRGRGSKAEAMRGAWSSHKYSKLIYSRRADMKLCRQIGIVAGSSGTVNHVPHASEIVILPFQRLHQQTDCGMLGCVRGMKGRAGIEGSEAEARGRGACHGMHLQVILDLFAPFLGGILQWLPLHTAPRCT